MKRYSSKTLLIIALSVLSVSAISQTSPFSAYGIGDLYNNGFGRNFAMGGTGIGIRTNQYLNSVNPASYTAMDSLSFFFEAGIKAKFQTIVLDNSTYHSKIDIDYFAFGFPICKFIFTSIGLRPAAITNYHFREITDAATTNYIGKGNMSNLYGGLGFKITRSLSLGAHVSYLFGVNKNFYTLQQPNAERVYGKKIETEINDVFFEFGAQYIIDLKKDRLIIGGIFSPKKSINGKNSWIFGEGVDFDDDGFVIVSHEINYKSNSKDAEMPLGFGIGLSYIVDGKVTFAADYASKRWGDVSLFIDDTSDFYQTANANYYSAGMEWVPNELTGINYFERVRYRLGLHYADDYIKNNNGKQVKDYGLCFGMGFPLRRTFTSINFSVDIGTKRLFDKSVSNENYGKVTVSFSMHEYWFMKNKIR